MRSAPPKAAVARKSSSSCSRRIARMPLAKKTKRATENRLRIPPATILAEASV
jgi:hypothetical protein